MRPQDNNHDDSLGKLPNRIRKSVYDSAELIGNGREDYGKSLGRDQRHGIRTEDGQLVTSPVQKTQGALNLGFVDMAFEIDEEDVFRLGGLRGKRFDPGEIQLGS